jgi:CubicO group peptidase (beta-lactamase class C family)
MPVLTAIRHAARGEVAREFEPVRRVFSESLRRGEEWGAALCIWHEGRVVVDVWGGAADRSRGTPWEEGTLATLFSSTKGLVALGFLMLADRGRLDYDAPVARYWPELATHGKGALTVRTLLNHRAGLITVDEPLTLERIARSPDEVAHLLARQQPRWAPGTDQGYHAVTYGLYAAELFRRIAGESVGVFLAREVAQPLGADVYIGLPAALDDRVAHNHPATWAERALRIVPKLLFDPRRDGRVYRQVAFGGDAAAAFANPRELGPRGIDNFNRSDVRRMELPWCNGIASARGLCRVYAVLANGGSLDGVRLVDASAIEPLLQRQSWSARDRVLRKPVGWSQGFLKEETSLFSPNPESFGHAGAGGALGWCDPKARLAIGYVTSKMDHRVRSRRALALARAAYACVAR